MTTAQELMAAQRARLSALDPWLPDEYLLPRGEPLTARLPDGGAVAGLMTHESNPLWTQQSLWSAVETYELFPLVGEQPNAGMDALLTAWRAELAQRGIAESDSSCVVTWPSRDVAATRAFLDHGMVPMVCLAVRPPDRSVDTELSGTVNIRRAGSADLDVVVEFMLAELEYAALVGGAVLRPDARDMKRAAAHVRLYSSGRPGSDPVWLAERDGAPVGLAECGWIDTARQHGRHRLRSGLWGYVNCLSVHEKARGTGVGRGLMTWAHNQFAHAGVIGSFLYYNPANPLSSVFWPRQGYRPLWTMWEVRPATALR